MFNEETAMHLLWSFLLLGTLWTSCKFISVISLQLAKCTALSNEDNPSAFGTLTIPCFGIVQEFLLFQC